MYETRIWNDKDKFTTSIDRSRNFMGLADANRYAQEESLDNKDTLIAVVEDGRGSPYSIFLNGRQFTQVEIDT